MAKQPEIIYINSYVAGTMAYQIESAPVRKKKPVRLPKARRQKQLVIAVDPVAIFGIAVAAVMAVVLLVGCIQLAQANQEAQVLRTYVETLQQENAELKDTYTSGYDLEQIRQTALAMGLVPVEQVEHIQVDVVIPQQEAEPTAWESFCAFLAGLFA